MLPTQIGLCDVEAEGLELGDEGAQSLGGGAPLLVVGMLICAQVASPTLGEARHTRLAR
jgi:hypothetical protein